MKFFKCDRASVVGMAIGALIGVTAVTSVPAFDVDGTKVASCVIRFDHEDRKTPTMLGGSHACMGVESVRINPNSGRVQLFLDIKDPQKWAITAPFTLPDEQLAGIVTMGASGGTDDVEIAMHELTTGRTLDLRKQSDRDLIWGKDRNFWYWSEWVRQSEVRP